MRVLPQTALITALAIIAAGYLHAQAAPQFEVAAIKPAPPQPEGRTSTQISSNTDTGQLHYSNINLKQMIGVAYKVPQFQVNGPDVIETERFDVVAKFQPKSSPDDVPLMVQALLAERFHFAFHRQTKELPVYALTVAPDGPKFKPTEGKSDDINTNSSRAEVHMVAKVPMSRLVEFLTNQTGRPVLDKTGLTGSYELKLDWARENLVTPTTENTLPSLFTALTEQLGLKLQFTRGPVELIVVDAVDRVPTAN